jgi:hypothetical protein
MSDHKGARPPAPGPYGSALTTDQVRVFADRAPRCKVRITVLFQPLDEAGVVEAQLVNVSKTGMFVAATRLLPIGTTATFQFRLDDDLIALSGTAEVVRLVEAGERGMGLRFEALVGEGSHLVDRIVDVTSTEPPPVPVETTPPPAGALPVRYDHGSVRLVLSEATAAYFTYNPLLHIGVGGCFLPAESDVPIGTGYQLDIVDAGGHVLLRCKAKVAARQEGRIGIRLVDVDRDELLRLRAEIARLGAAAP